MHKDSKIYVAGHSGLVGSAIVRKLQNEGYDNLLLKSHQELELTDHKSVKDLFEALLRYSGILIKNDDVWRETVRAIHELWKYHNKVRDGRFGARIFQIISLLSIVNPFSERSFDISWDVIAPKTFSSSPT
ncbi:MAG: NAD-dependent epimerase/dehydratase family protein [Candidatus Marinimicrobia bacterium]|nr:NAD-dependent epimerase/dehydratase family protein [Candidatus Neomarinimicrobiota bacterium]